jgi:hypothetical protein
MRHYDEPRDSDPPFKSYSVFDSATLKEKTPKQRKQERKLAIKTVIETMERIYGKAYINDLKAKLVNKSL